MIKDKIIKKLLIPHTKAQSHGEKKEQKTKIPLCLRVRTIN